MKKFILLLVISQAQLTAQIISTVAGNGVQGFSGDYGIATAAQLAYPNYISISDSGNIYISDGSNQRIRKVNAITGIITTVAGNGTQGYNGDGILATSAELNVPRCVIVDSAENIYIADFANNRIRKVDAITGLISTIAGTGNLGFSGDGGLATAAMINYPTGLAFDKFGNLFIADNHNNRVRKIDKGTDIINTVAGTGIQGFNGDTILATSAQLYYPQSIAIDTAGNIYIADSQNNRIRKVSSDSGYIYTVAGVGTPSYSGDGGLAIAAELNQPHGVALDKNENIYIADRNNQRIRKIDAGSGIINTIAGTGTIGYNGDGISATMADLNSPIAVTLDTAGNYYIADDWNNRIRMVTINTSTEIMSVTKSGQEFKLYPNPNDGKFTIEINNSAKQTIKIFNANGNLVLSGDIINTTTCDLAKFNSGVYSVILISSMGILYQKLVILNPR